MTTVMLVDDSAILMSLSSILAKAGYQVETAGDGREALDKISTGLKPHLIISDGRHHVRPRGA